MCKKSFSNLDKLKRHQKTWANFWRFPNLRQLQLLSTSLTDRTSLARETADPSEKSSIDQQSVTLDFEPGSVDQQSIIALQFGGDDLQSVDGLNLGGEVELFLYEEQVFIMEKFICFFIMDI